MNKIIKSNNYEAYFKNIYQTIRDNTIRHEDNWIWIDEHGLDQVSKNKNESAVKDIQQSLPDYGVEPVDLKEPMNSPFVSVPRFYCL